MQKFANYAIRCNFSSIMQDRNTALFLSEALKIVWFSVVFFHLFSNEADGSALQTHLLSISLVSRTFNSKELASKNTMLLDSEICHNLNKIIIIFNVFEFALFSILLKNNQVTEQVIKTTITRHVQKIRQ